MNVSFPKISEVEINGLNPDERKIIEDIIYDSDFKNIFYLDKEYLKRKINSINIIEQFEIFKNYPSTLKIFIEKTEILAQTKKNGFDYLIGSNGKLIENKELRKIITEMFETDKSITIFRTLQMAGMEN